MYTPPPLSFLRTIMVRSVLEGVETYRTLDFQVFAGSYSIYFFGSSEKNRYTACLGVHVCGTGLNLFKRNKPYSYHDVFDSTQILQ